MNTKANMKIEAVATYNNERDFTRQVAITIDRQLLTGAGNNVYWSWGIDKKYFTEINEKSGLMIRVNGFRLNGWVYILLDEGSDLYEVFTQTGRRLNLEKAKKVAEGVYCDMLSDVVDELVETGGMTKDEYEKRVASATYAI